MIKAVGIAVVALAIIVGLVLFPREQVILGAADSGKVLQVGIRGSVWGEQHLFLRAGTAEAGFHWLEHELGCSLDMSQDFFKQVRSLAWEDGSFNLLLNSPGACYRDPPNELKLDGILVHIDFVER